MAWGQIAAAGIGAAASIMGANSASNAMQRAARDNAYTSQQVYNQQRGDLAPYRETGIAANAAIARLNGLDMPVTYQPSRTYSEIGKASEYDVVTAFQEFLGRAPTEKERKYYAGRTRADQLYNDVIRPGVERKTAELTASQPAQQANPNAPVNPNDPEGRYGDFYASPSYNFVRDQGLQAQDRNYASRGLFNSGARARAATEYGANVASTEFDNYYRRLAGQADAGQNAAVNTGNFASQYAGNATSANNNQALSRASGYLGRSGAVSGAVNNVLAAAPYWANTRAPSRSDPRYSQPYDPTNPYT